MHSIREFNGSIVVIPTPWVVVCFSLLLFQYVFDIILKLHVSSN